jgi:hypothetical protein
VDAVANFEADFDDAFSSTRSHTYTNMLSRRNLLGVAAGIGLTAPFPMNQSLASTPQIPVNPAGDAIVPFRIAIPQVDLDDLTSRLRFTRWPEKETVQDWSQGVPLAKAKSLIDAWRYDYSWRNFESRANSYPQYLTNVDGLDIHFIHVRSHEANALPIVLTHGWPGSFVEFLESIGPLTDPVNYGGKANDAFDVVIPSLPGYALFWQANGAWVECRQDRRDVGQAHASTGS